MELSFFFFNKIVFLTRALIQKQPRIARGPVDHVKVSLYNYYYNKIFIVDLSMSISIYYYYYFYYCHACIFNLSYICLPINWQQITYTLHTLVYDIITVIIIITIG